MFCFMPQIKLHYCQFGAIFLSQLSTNEIYPVLVYIGITSQQHTEQSYLSVKVFPLMKQKNMLSSSYQAVLDKQELMRYDWLNSWFSLVRGISLVYIFSVKTGIFIPSVCMWVCVCVCVRRGGTIHVLLHLRLWGLRRMWQRPSPARYPFLHVYEPVAQVTNTYVSPIYCRQPCFWMPSCRLHVIPLKT